MVRVRHPCQAGSFYEGNPNLLRRQIESCFTNKLGPGRLPKVATDGPRRIVGVICPHAGYMYSGPVAAHSYYQLAIDGRPDLIILLGPNHTGLGSGIALMNEGLWRTPLGDVEIDTETANWVVQESRIVDVDETAHSFEHSIEVQLPFLQYFYGNDFKIVPICFLMQDLNSAREVGEAIAKVVARKNAVIIASSDMTHYEPQEKAQKKDSKALEAITAMDEAGLYAAVESLHISACGYGPMATLITSAKHLGVKEAKLLCYKTSGDVIGDYSGVVGYAAVCFKK